MKTALSAAVLFLFLSSPAEANIIELHPFHSGPGAWGFGWRSESVVQPLYNGAYTTGWTTLDGKPTLTRGFLSFSLNNWRLLHLREYHNAIGGVELRFPRIPYLSPDPIETLGIFDVTTPAASLYAKSDLDRAIFGDLGTGDLYASVDVSADANSWITIRLNADAVQDVKSNLGGVLSLGLSLISASPTYIEDESLFGLGSAPELRILLSIVPEPAVVNLAASSLLGMPLIRQLRRSNRRCTRSLAGK